MAYLSMSALMNEMNSAEAESRRFFNLGNTQAEAERARLSVKPEEEVEVEDAPEKVSPTSPKLELPKVSSLTDPYQDQLDATAAAFLGIPYDEESVRAAAQGAERRSRSLTG